MGNQEKFLIDTETLTHLRKLTELLRDYATSPTCIESIANLLDSECDAIERLRGTSSTVKEVTP